MSDDSLSVLVTGASGFIGSHVCEALRDSGHFVTGMASHRSRDTFGWLDHVHGVDKIRGDVRDSNQMSRIICGGDYDIICHLAALISVPDSYERPYSYMETNAIGTMNVLMAASLSETKVIHTSTSEVYGTAQYSPMDENHPIVPQSPYAASKVSADAICESFGRSYDMDIVTLRPFNTYGPRQSSRAVTAQIINQMISGDDHLSLGNISSIRDFTYVKDTAAAYVSALTLSGGVYNVASMGPISIQDWAKFIWETYGNSHLNLTTKTSRLRPPKSEVDKLYGDSSLFKNKTGWKTTSDLTDSIKKTIRWAQSVKRENGEFI